MVTRRTRRSASLIAILAVGALVASACNYVRAPFLIRVDQPVVLTGADIPDAIGLDPGRATLWRYEGGWVQIPVQVDERHVVDFGTQPANNNTAGTTGTVYGNGSSGVTALQYSDPDTFVGADPTATFDADDELVFMARDAGDQAPGGLAKPPGTVAGSGREIVLSDPDGGAQGHVYLWYGQVGADPSAGQDYVDYTFDLTSGDYKTTYKRANGPNPETSTVSTYAYDLGMIDRWKTTDLTPAAGTGVDILDGFKCAGFTFSTCSRSNDTFADAEGAFAANIDGPIRGIRSYVGANSGPRTQETLFFYAEHIEQVIDLRVHAIPSVMSFIDYSAAASGMQYGSSAMGAATATIDGNPTGDNVPTSPTSWEYISGPQGGVTIVADVTTTATITRAREWVDDSTPPYTECWGDGDYYGVNANKIISPIPNTDPFGGAFETLQSRAIVAVWPPNVHLDDWAPAWASEVHQPLDTTVSTY